MTKYWQMLFWVMIQTAVISVMIYLFTWTQTKTGGGGRGHKKIQVAWAALAL